jgi:phosphoribosylanthranilate isomerase
MRIAQLPFVKICCISSVDEARLAVAAGASALGLVSAMPSGPGVIAQQLIAQIASSVPPPVATFLLTSLRDADEIILQHRECGTNTIQLVDQVPLRQLEKLRRKLPGIKLVQVVHVTGLDSIGEADAVAPFVDALLLDSGNPALPIKELGGTGRTHDWNLSRRICSESKVPVFLAGGLNATNVALAISSTRPFGLDLCSAVRTDGRLDADKLRDFFAVLRLLATS